MLNVTITLHKHSSLCECGIHSGRPGFDIQTHKALASDEGHNSVIDNDSHNNQCGEVCRR